VKTPTFYISSVDEAQYRIRPLREHLADVGLENYKIVPAVNGHHLAESFHDPRPTTHNGHYGCALSKLDILERFCIGKEEIAFLGEDDIRFHEFWQSRYSRMMAELPSDWEYANLAGIIMDNKRWDAKQTLPPTVRRKVSEHLWEASECNTMGAIMLRGDRIMNLFADFIRGDWKQENIQFAHCDWGFSAVCRTQGIPCYVPEPRIATQAVSFSFIEQKLKDHHCGGGDFNRV